MTSKFKVISNTREEAQGGLPTPPEGVAVPSLYRRLGPEDRLRHFRNVTGSVLQNALETWGDLRKEFQGTDTHGALATPEAAKGFVPECGWPEFQEKMWLLEHYLDYAKRFCEGK